MDNLLEIFNGIKPRITYISVFDIIKAATKQTDSSIRKAWKRIENQYPEITPYCHYCQFGKSKKTPCINLNGFVKIMMWLPGEEAKNFRDKSAIIIIRSLGGDLSLIDEIKNTNQFHIENGENNIFRHEIKVKNKLIYDESYYMYVRVFSPFFETRQKNIKNDEKLRKLSWYIIKFGIAKNIQNRESSYGNDYGTK